MVEMGMPEQAERKMAKIGKLASELRTGFFLVFVDVIDGSHLTMPPSATISSPIMNEESDDAGPKVLLWV
jgi:hypothetical protein